MKALDKLRAALTTYNPSARAYLSQSTATVLFGESYLREIISELEAERQAIRVAWDANDDDALANAVGDLLNDCR